MYIQNTSLHKFASLLKTIVLYTSTHYLYQQKYTLFISTKDSWTLEKLLLELVFTAHTVPVVQVQYQHSVRSDQSTVVAQYSLW